MSILYLDEYGAKLRYSSGRLIAEKDGGETAGLRIQEIDYVVVLENCGITSAALGAMLRHGIETVFLSNNGECLGRLEPVFGKNVLLRKSQYLLSCDETFRTEIARRIVQGKISNMRIVVMRYARSHGCFDAAELEQRLKTALDAARTAENLDALRGIEGTAAEAYFALFPKILKDPWAFEGRNRRPPRDPVNAALGFSYALLENLVERAVSVTGLDPYCGFLHQDVYGRRSLALDLMEEFRPIIADSVVLGCCIRKILDPSIDFEERDGGVFLNEEGRQKFFRAFAARERETVQVPALGKELSYADLCAYQARMMAACIRSRDPNYIPFSAR